MHRPHRWQRFRKSASGSEPGGRISAGEGNFDIWPSSLPRSGRETPASSPPINARRPISVVAFFLRIPLKRKARAFSLQAFVQLKHNRHSAFCHGCPGSGEAAPWQALTHAPQWVHLVSSFSRVRRVNREKTPRSAPKGQRNRHQKRGRIRFRKSMIRKRMPIIQPV